MTHLPIPLEVLYAGLGGTVLALIVATITNGWSLRVFCLLALRLAIGWHFLFEGLHKVHTHFAGPTDTSRPFTSEPYFKVAPGPVGALMRKQFDDPEAVFATKLKRTQDITPEAFASLKVEQQAEACPPDVAKEFDALAEQAEAAIRASAETALKAADSTEKKAIDEANATEQRKLKGELTAAEKQSIREKAEAARRKARFDADARRLKARAQLAALQDSAQDLVAAVKGQPDGEKLAEQLEGAVKKFRDKAEEGFKAPDAEAEKLIAEATAAEQRQLKPQPTDADKAKITADAEKDRKAAREIGELAREVARNKAAAAKEDAAKLVTAAKATYARWVYGVDTRPAKVKFVTGDALLTAPQRLELLEELRNQVKANESWRSRGLGNGYGTDTKKAGELRMDLVAAEGDLARDTNAFVTELKTALNGGKAPEAPAREMTRGQLMDKVTMWFLVGVGGCLLAGLFTRVACVLAAGFLVMTYLAHPPFPWFPLPPNTEGNPLFVNKNVIECLALLTIATFPTGRWLGLDALVLRPFCRGKNRAA